MTAEASPAGKPSPMETAGAIAGMLHERQRAHWEKEAQGRQGYSRDWNWASDIGWPCARRLFYERTQSERVEIRPPEDECLMAEGRRIHEPDVVDMLREYGFRLYAEQKRIRDPHDRISTKPEGRLEFGGVEVLAEIKGCSPYSWARYNTAEDVKAAVPWGRLWYAQVQVGMYESGLEAAVLILKNKLTGWWRVIPIALDADYLHDVLERAQEVNAGVETGIEPDFILDPGECQWCPWRDRICLPPHAAGGEAVIVGRPDAIEAAETAMRLRDAAAEYDAAVETLKAVAKSQFLTAPIEPEKKRTFTAIVGKLVIRLADKARASYTVPATRYREARVDFKVAE